MININNDSHGTEDHQPFIEFWYGFNNYIDCSWIKNIEKQNKNSITIKNHNLTYQAIDTQWPKKENISDHEFSQYIEICRRKNEHINFFYTFFFSNELQNRREFENMKAALSLEQRMELIIDNEGNDNQTATNILLICFEKLPSFIFSRIKLSFKADEVEKYIKKTESIPEKKKKNLSKIFGHILKISEKEINKDHH